MHSPHYAPLALRATGAFRVVTECHYGPTKGSESPLATVGRVRGVSPLLQSPSG